MTRNELMTALIIWEVSGAADTTIGIVVPSYSESKRFIKDLNSQLNELPDWIKPRVRSKHTRGIEFDRLRIQMLYSMNCSRGRTLDSIHISSRVTKEQLTQHCFSVLPLIGNGSIHTFEDE